MLRAALEPASTDFAGAEYLAGEFCPCTALDLPLNPNWSHGRSPIEEEFDGNDLVAAHFIGFVGREPAGCLRVRFFGEFAKVERLAVRHQFRRSRVSFKLVQASVEYVKRKGFRKIYGQAQDRLVDFWAHFGAKPLGHNRKITFSDFSYTEMVLDIEPGPDAITLDSDPYVIIRPEGDWDRPGVLDLSSGRAASSPLLSPVVTPS